MNIDEGLLTLFPLSKLICFLYSVSILYSWTCIQNSLTYEYFFKFVFISNQKE